MKAGTLLLSATLLIPALAPATTLRLTGDVDLLVLDGKRVSSSLLRGADGIELDNGPHQVVFRVEKIIQLPDRSYQRYASPPLIASFDTRLISLVNVNLPRLETREETQSFSATPEITLLDGNAAPIPVTLDILAVTRTAAGIDYEQAAAVYNHNRKLAVRSPLSAPLPDDSTLLSKKTELDFPSLQSQTLAEQRLKYWFQQADSDTRNRFLQWARQQPSS
ncbi:uncharacterized UPF0319 family protein [Trabulsiella guamensis ATCC 49490]|uniref:UPF0319 protein GTGU_01029 n=1 Tax=Trabulsiella guamensis ATCC 49490 TaxID=1005994 RepID=A0A085AFU5_9ENTR|nr:DUF2057 family protein [Trabulsiella guamensis]KFC09090.1 uncharacterized UPF0319 family protein [Trabulsiella guamensis ATCC 49490]